MARRCVTYLGAGTATGPADRTEVALGPPAPVRREPPSRQRSGLRGPFAVIAAAVAVVIAWPGGGVDDADPPRSPEPTRIAPAPAPTSAVGDVVDVAPAGSRWRGELVRTPDARGTRLVPRIHLLSATRVDGFGRALAVVDATRRAFPGAPRPAGPADVPVRAIGVAEGTGLRTWQWDEAGYGISLTTVGLTTAEQRRVAIAIDIPGGRSLVSGRVASWEDDVLARTGLAPLEVRSGAASLSGGPAIGQPGGASLGGYLTEGTGPQARSVRLDVTHVPVLSAARVVRALGRDVLADAWDVPGASVVAALDHPGAPPGDAAQGWHRVLVDLPGLVTATLSSDSVEAAALVEIAGEVDLRRLAGLVAPG